MATYNWEMYLFLYIYICVCVYSQSISIIFTHIQYRPMIDIDKKFGDCQAIPGHPLLSKEHRQHLHSLQIQHLITNPHTAKGLHQNLHFSHASATESERRRLCWVGFPALIDMVCFHSERSSSNLCSAVKPDGLKASKKKAITIR